MKNIKRTILSYGPLPKIIAAVVIVGVASIGVAMMRFSGASIAEYINAVSQTQGNISGVTFNVRVIYSDGSEKDVGNRTTPVSIDSGGSFYKLTFVSAPSGYSFSAWRVPNGTTYSSASITFSTESYNGQTVSIVLNDPIPPRPNVSLLANNSSSDISVGYQSSLTLSWSTSNNPSSCTASGNWSGGKAASGSENRSADTGSAGTKTYQLTCSNAGGSTTATRYVTVGQPPAPAPSPTPPPASSPTPTPTPTSPPLQGSSNVVPAPITATADTTPPAVPKEFRAVTEEGNFTITVSWQAGGDESDVARYVLERSEDKTNWSVLGDEITDLSYEDQDTRFGTKYYYRIKAVDASGNASEYANADIISNNFVSNITKAGGGTIFADNVVTVNFPAEAVPEDLYCVVQISQELLSGLKGYKLVAGPYEIICKEDGGSRVFEFSKPISVSIDLSDEQTKKYADSEYYIRRDNNWVNVLAEDNTLQLENSTIFAMFAKQSGTPLWVKILLVLFTVIALGLGVVGLFYLRYRRQQQQALEDYYRKASGG